MGDPAERMRNLERLLEIFDADAKLEQMSDAEIAQLVEDHLWSAADMLDPSSSLLRQAIDRLRRANGGALPPEEK